MVGGKNKTEIIPWTAHLCMTTPIQYKLAISREQQEVFFEVEAMYPVYKAIWDSYCK